MPPQIKHDINRAGWETTDFPSVCERCLPDNPFVQMLKEDYGPDPCKICTRPFTIFRWKADRTARQKKTNICLTCARLKNCCQCCMLDLSFGLPIVVRDAALKMVAPGPQSSVNREFYAQNHEKEIEEGRGGVEEYEKTDEKARELLRRLANSEPYYKKQRRIEATQGTEGQKALPAPADGPPRYGPGPIRTKDSRGGFRGGARGGRGGGARGGRGLPGPAQLPPGPQDILPPEDPNITSLFVTGVEDDLPEHELRTFFAKFGTLRSLVCSHRAHCAFINFTTRQGAEAAAESCQGKAIIQGCPLRVQWGKPKPLDTMERDERITLAKEGRAMVNAARAPAHQAGNMSGGSSQTQAREEALGSVSAIAAPPGAEDINYWSLQGDN